MVQNDLMQAMLHGALWTYQPIHRVQGAAGSLAPAVGSPTATLPAATYIQTPHISNRHKTSLGVRPSAHGDTQKKLNWLLTQNSD